MVEFNIDDYTRVWEIYCFDNTVDLGRELTKLNKQDMKNEKLLKRIEQTREELGKLEAELKSDDIIEYVRVYSNLSVCKHGGIMPVVGTSGSGCCSKHKVRSECDRIFLVLKSDCEPSTKQAFDKQNEIIRVPECIKFVKLFSNIRQNYCYGIVFNDNKQILYSEKNYNVFDVSTHNILNGSNFKLTPIDRKDLVAGDVAYRSNGKLNRIEDSSHYCLILDSKTYVYPNFENGISIFEGEVWSHWYKVERI